MSTNNPGIITLGNNVTLDALSTVYGTTTNNSYTVTSWQNALEVQGDAIFDKDVEIKGNLKYNSFDVLDRIKVIEQRLGILVPEPLSPDPVLLAKYEELQQKKKEYEELEASYKTFYLLKT